MHEGANLRISVKARDASTTRKKQAIPPDGKPRFEALILRPLLQNFIHPVCHVLEDRGGSENIETGLRRDARDGVEPGDDAGKLADEGDDLDGFAHTLDQPVNRLIRYVWDFHPRK